MAKRVRCETSKEKDRKRQADLRKEVITYYGGKCACCPEDTLEFLQLDHIDGTGVKSKDRRKHPKTASGYWLYSWLKKNGWPTGFQVLCANCNYVKRFGTPCPHKDFDLRHGLKFVA